MRRKLSKWLLLACGHNKIPQMEEMHMKHDYSTRSNYFTHEEAPNIYSAYDPANI